jgi:TetR/AcrR family transcriptional regulator, mexCD-oprJ operon repressor
VEYFVNAEIRRRAPRADGVRNRIAILDAALACLNVNSRASMVEIAAAASVGRVTLYGHFSTREELIHAAMSRAMDKIETVLEAIDLNKPPLRALEDLIGASWRLVDQYNGLRAVADHELGFEPDRDLHDRPMHRVRLLLARGRDSGAFRSDQSIDWQVACFFAVLHGAAAEVRAGRLTEQEVASVAPETVRALLLPPPTTPLGRSA